MGTTENNKRQKITVANSEQFCMGFFLMYFILLAEIITHTLIFFVVITPSPRDRAGRQASLRSIARLY